MFASVKLQPQERVVML